MPIMFQRGSIPSNAPNNMWGWFDNVDTEAGNPCLSGAADKREWHDMDQNGFRDSTMIEQHCIKPGRYQVDLKIGGVTYTRIVDHLKSTKAPIIVRNKSVEDPQASSSTDTFVHIELQTAVTFSNNIIEIDNPLTSAEFVPGDTLVPEDVRVRFDSPVGTSWSGDPRGKLMNRVNFDVATGTILRTAYWNPQLVIRTNSYSLDGAAQRTFRVLTEVVTPSDRTGENAGRKSPERRVVVQRPPVATVDVSPSSASIIVQNGTTTLTATLRDANGNILTGRTIAWISSNASVATVSGNGGTATVTGIANGTATITATSEGRNDAAAITVNFPVGPDDAIAVSHTLPGTFVNGSAVSVTVSMKNTGQTTWTPASFYKLFQSRGLEFWVPGEDPVTGSVGPNVTHAFAFDLRMDDPSQSGTTPCFFRMARDLTYFGAESGRDIKVTLPVGLAAAEAEGMMASEMAPTMIDPSSWISGATDAGTTPLGLGSLRLREGEGVVFEYAYAHEVDRSIDVVFKFVFDSRVFEPLPLQPGFGASGLSQIAGLSESNEYWVRLTGTVPAGEGVIVGFPFRLREGARPTKDLGTLTMLYPQN
ncbi:MAG TPA: Ig-like domain-containing protein [Gemmatimonadota bacterium]|nr:Ig-like domain-containing protein [Gemmatimonadota bacterium]